MYKKQMTLQRIVCYALLIAAALVFVYSLGLMTDLYDSGLNYFAEDYYRYQEDPANLMVLGSEVYYDMQGFNRSLTLVGIALILLAVAQFMFQNHNRRKYYIANYITVGASTIGAVTASVWALSNIFKYKAQYLKLDFETLKLYAELFKFEYTDSTFWFDASVVVFALLLIVAVVNVINMFWKISLMKAEKKLIKAGKEGKAA